MANILFLHNAIKFHGIRMRCHLDQDYFYYMHVLFCVLIKIRLFSSSGNVILSNYNGKDSLIYQETLCFYLSLKGINKIVSLAGHIDNICKRNLTILKNCFIIFTHYILAFYKQPWRRRCPSDHHKQSPLCFLVALLHVLLSTSTLQPNVRRLFQLKTNINKL